jgi:isoquinoline 1-oxidoreductase beta subunit
MAAEPRAAGVLKAVAKLANWGSPVPAGRARGVAVVESFSTFVAEIAEVSIGEWRTQGAQGLGGGRLRRGGQSRHHPRAGGRRHRLCDRPYPLWRGAAGGWATDRIQFQRLSLAEDHGDARGGSDDRPSSAPPTGIGEPGVPPCGPAIANALARLGRDRPTHLPMVRQA